MNRICLALPTNRQCAETIALLHQEAEYAFSTFNIPVCLLIIDTSDEQALAANLAMVTSLETHQGVEVVHVDKHQQTQFLSTLCQAVTADESQRLLDLLLPEGVSYGACTNRAFLLAAALGCDSVHRRDSDCDYQLHQGNIVFPVHQELLALGKTAATVQDPSISNALSDAQRALPVSMVAASFIGEMSVDIEEIRQLSPSVYHNVVKLWAEQGASEQEQSQLVEQSFKGAGTQAFSEDKASLGRADPMLVDMCNISFYGVHEKAPLPPAKDTIGSDYFLIHLVYHSALPALVHNRHITNFYTPERKTDEGFIRYQRRFIKFMLSMPYLHCAYKLMAAAGADNLLTPEQQINNAQVCHIIESTLNIDNTHCHVVFDQIIKNYTRLGGRYKALTNLLTDEKDSLIQQARTDMEDYLYLSRNWIQLINLAKESGL